MQVPLTTRTFATVTTKRAILLILCRTQLIAATASATRHVLRVN